jgi:hypothetical protein
MSYKELTLCAILISFAGGVFYGFNDNAEAPKPRLIKHSISPKILPAIDNTLRPCSEVNTMPCDVSPPNPVKDALDEVQQRDGLFKKGEEVTCIYQGIFCWDNRDEFVKAIPMVCKVLQASEPFDDLEKDYQHIQVDCSKDLVTKSSDQPGAGMVKDHKLNYKIQWFSSTDCYHFVQH